MQGTEAMRDIRRWVGGRAVRTGVGVGGGEVGSRGETAVLRGKDSRQLVQRIL